MYYERKLNKIKCVYVHMLKFNGNKEEKKGNDEVQSTSMKSMVTG